MKSPKLRISVPFSQELYDKVELNSQKLGIAKSSYISFIVAQFIKQEEIVYSQLGNAINNLSPDLIKLIQDSKKKEDQK